LGLRPETEGSLSIEQRIYAPFDEVAAFIGEDSYRLTLDSPIGKLEPEARVVEHSPRTIRWVYDSAIEGGGRVDVSPEADGCVVNYTGEFRLKRRLWDRAARLVGVEHFARKNGERSLSRLKHLMEARRYR
jgi:hypothetical protein